ncbi:glycosyl hydrolase-related protein [Geotoga petraea]|uniref:Alpha-mannosidase n=1 Tax=Geotoga petraea TaxID=28234 RepID=A0A1G6NPF9_9BACT|nr:glycosyl hydrolase-related protein [Geotoga petraea]TGG87794.1 hypothetical protein E4650_05465 [Geotoga petraea]SDC69840.1 alpha-mannosidase [Geotoga petraea]
MKAHVVTHTHWDREWYMPFEIYRARLIKLIDELIENIDKYEDFKYFTLDGQVIAMEDYIEARPENKEKLLKLIRDKKVYVGPWYILPDEFTISGESFIRNYLIAKKIMEKLEIERMKLAYLPDMFGHNAYTPSLIKGLNLQGALVWRGVGTSSRKNEFIWQSENGLDNVNTINNFRSYTNAYQGDNSKEKMYEIINTEINELQKTTESNSVLLMNGVDHEKIYFETPEIFKNIKEHEVIHSTLDDFYKETFSNNLKLETVKGELRDPTYEPTLKDITSTRIYLKLLNFENQNNYYKYLEPLSVISMIKGKKSYTKQIEMGIKKLVKSHPHDSICGCSVDSVHRDVMTRLEEALQISDTTIAMYMDEISGSKEKGDNIILFNPNEFDIEEKVEVYMTLDKDEYSIFDGDEKIPTKIKNKGYWLLNHEKTRLILGGTKHFKLISEMDSYINKTSIISQLDKNIYKISFMAKIPALSFKTYKIKESKNQIIIGKKNKYENDLIEFKINEDGSFDLKDKINKIKYEKVNSFWDSADVGDEYNYSYIENDEEKLIGSKYKNLDYYEYKDFVEFFIEKDIPLPAYSTNTERSKKTEINIAKIKYIVYKTKSRVDVDLIYENKSKDHRLRIKMPLSKATEKIYNDGYYGLVEHPTIQENKEPISQNGGGTSYMQLNSDGYIEENVPRYATESFITDKKITFVSRGLHEYEVENKNQIKITLIRSVGQLSKNGLKTRKVGAGPTLPTPEAQCMGKYKYEYAYIFQNQQTDYEIYKHAKSYINKPLAYNSKNQLNENVIGDFSGLNIYSIKRTYNDQENTYIVRFANHENEKDFEIKLNHDYKKIDEVNMAEETIKQDIQKIKIKKGEIKTIKIYL